MKIITVGSSAGGYAAVRFGEWLGAERVLAFSPRLNFEYLLNHEWDTNPIARTLPLHEIELIQSITFTKANHFIFYPKYSKLDNIQVDNLRKAGLYPQLPNKSDKLNICLLSTSHHGIPFPKAALSNVINAPNEHLMKFSGRIVSPFTFAADFIGWPATISGYYLQMWNGIRKKIKQKLLK